MDEPQIYARLTNIFEDVFDDDSIKLTPELSAKDVDGWDSLTHVRLLLTIEKAFATRFSTSEIGKLESVGDLVALIKAHS
jgi:acyl carrier protein